MTIQQRILFSVAYILAASLPQTSLLAAIPAGVFVDAKPVEGINLAAEDSPVISANGLELFFDSAPGGGPSDLYVATRSNRNEPFKSVAKVEGISSTSDEDSGSISSDGLTLFFGSNRGGSYDLYRATRDDLQSSFGDVTSLGSGVNTGQNDNYPFVSADGQQLYFHRSSVGGSTDHRLSMASWDPALEVFDQAVDLGDKVNGSPTLDSWRPSISADGLTLFFSDSLFGSPRPDGHGSTDIWVAHRSDQDAAFGEPVNLNDAWPGSQVNSTSIDGLASISPDWPAAGSKLYFTTTRTNQTDIWEATWMTETFGDFDGYGQLDAADIDRLIRGIIAGTNDIELDVTNDQRVDADDLTAWVKDIRRTWFGDANLDGEFSSRDFTQVFLAGEYEDAIADNSTWGEGDWNGDGDFTSGDFVTAFLDGGYEQGPRPAAAVPEPISNHLAMAFLMVVFNLLHRRSPKRSS